MRKSARILQKNIRNWLAKRMAVTENLKKYLQVSFIDLHARRVTEQFTVLGNMYREHPKKYGNLKRII
jgi:hypothetical protein